jgi:hypothetical protein
MVVFSTDTLRKRPVAISPRRLLRSFLQLHALLNENSRGAGHYQRRTARTRCARDRKMEPVALGRRLAISLKFYSFAASIMRSNS